MAKDVPSPLLPMDQVAAVLAEGLAAVGELGGSVAGAAGASGGARGGRFGAKLTKLDGEARTLDVPRTPDGVSRLQEHLGDGLRVLATDDQQWAAVAVVGSGVGGLNPAVVQLSWGTDRLEMTAHAREGLIKQGTSRKALDQVQDLVAT